MPRPPATGRVTAPYGPRRVRPTPTSPLFHYGEDRVGSGNNAPISGMIIQAAYVGSYGNRVVIAQNGSLSTHWWICHNASLPKRAGTRVTEGQYVAPMGATGNVTGVHVHTERRSGAGYAGGGNHTNPASYYTTSSGAPAGGTGVVIPKPTPPKPKPVPPTPEEEEEMAKNSGIYWKRASDGKTEYMVFNPESGFRINHSGTDGKYNNALAITFGTGSWAPVSEGHARNVMTELDAIQASKASGNVILSAREPIDIDVNDVTPDEGIGA